MNAYVLIWSLTCAFMIHDFEEIIVMEDWIRNNEQDMLSKLPRFFQSGYRKVFPKQTKGFAVAVLVEYIGIILFVVISTINPDNRWLLMFTLSINTVLFLHCFTHIGQTILFQRYTPGAVTAVILLVPYCLYFYYWLMHSGMIDVTVIVVSVPMGLAAAVLLNQLGLWLGKRLEGSGRQTTHLGA